MANPLKSEIKCKAECWLELPPWQSLKWIDLPADLLARGELKLLDTVVGKDKEGRSVLLFKSDWAQTCFSNNNPAIKLYDSPDKIGRG